jgi:hypothetical protein
MSTKIKYIIKDFFTFLIHPSKKENDKFGFFYYLIVFAFVMLATGILKLGIIIIFNIFNVPAIPNEASTASIAQISPILMTLIVSVIAPFFEEFSFRYPLKYTKNSLFIGIVAYIFVITFTTEYAVNKWINMTNFSIYSFKPAFWGHVTFAILLFVLTRFRTINNFLSKFWKKYLIIIIYLFAAYFAYCHFPLQRIGVNWIWLPVLVIIQFITALYFSYIRLRVKFLYCIFLHIILNGFTMLPFLLNI